MSNFSVFDGRIRIWHSLRVEFDRFLEQIDRFFELAGLTAMLKRVQAAHITVIALVTFRSTGRTELQLGFSQLSIDILERTYSNVSDSRMVRSHNSLKTGVCEFALSPLEDRTPVVSGRVFSRDHFINTRQVVDNSNKTSYLIKRQRLVNAMECMETLFNR